MSQGTDLLRLLEPNVRPVSPVKPATAAPGAARGAGGDLPFEAQDFDSLLASAREGGPAAEPAAGSAIETNVAKPPGPLDALADFGRIENPGLRELLAQQRNTALTSETRDTSPPPTSFPQQPAA